MTTIGITGSFGKTSTKEYLSTILSSSYKVLKTEASKNSPIGIAEVVLKQLKDDHEVLVVEMGAYKRGEIARMTEMVQPQVGIITAINPQHQDIFKTLETTMRAKYELIQGLPSSGIAIFNGDDEKTRTMAKWASEIRNGIWVYTKETRKWPAWVKKVIVGEKVKVGLNEITFTVTVGREKAIVTAKVLGAHQVDNILAAMAAALACGMSLKKAAKAASKLQPYSKTMQAFPGINGSIFINDTFNNNPDAAIAALDYLALTAGKKILVFQPMIELGAYAESAHKEVGTVAAFVCDEIFLTNSNFKEHFIAGIKEIYPEKHVWELPLSQTAHKIRAQIGNGDTVLFKGKEAEQVLRLLNS